VLLAAVVLVLALAAAAAVFVLARSPGGPQPAPQGEPTQSEPAQTETAPASPTASLPALGPGPLDILVMGSDVRGSARELIASQEAAGGTVDQRADMIMLVHVPADRSRVYGVSVMRDSWVSIAGHGEAKVNASLGLGGPRLVADTVGALLSVHVDHYVLLDFEGFKAVTDALGGVDVDVTVPFTASFETHHTFPAGVNRLSGQAALEFVRERYSFPDGDYQRVRNQQAFVRAMIARLLQTGRVGTPGDALAAVAAAAPFTITDPALDGAGLAALGYGLRGVDPAASAFFTLPTLGTGTSADGQSIVVLDDAGVAEVAAALSADTMDAYAAAHGIR
jgi:LCP family protein required for cell wall assembly